MKKIQRDIQVRDQVSPVERLGNGRYASDVLLANDV